MLATQGESSTLFRYRFGDTEFDESKFDLKVKGEPVEVQPKPLALLAMLLRTPGEVVTSEEILQSVWKYHNTSDLETNVLGTALTKLRNALGRDARRIVNVPRVGYRFTGRVERVVVGRTLSSGLALEPGMAVPLRSNFILHDLLSRSNHSEVWRARHAKTEERRIYKFSPDGDRLPALKREATLYRVLHEALGERLDIVRVIDWNFAEAPFFLECEDAGQNLRQWAAEANRLRELDLPARLALFLQIADAVAAAHGVGVLHKDLKPDNVLIAPRGEGWQVRLTDFGSGKLLEPNRLADLGITQLGFTATQTGAEDTSGTFLYMAPELGRGEAPTVRSDVYALGLLLYQLVTGDMRRPLVPGWQREVKDELLQQDIAAATDGNPNHRMGSAGELAKALRHLPERRAELARQRALEQTARLAQEQLKRSRARRPWLIAALASMAMGFAVSSFLYVESRRAYLAAEQQRVRAEAVNGFLNNDLLGAADLNGPGAERDPTVRQLLERAAGRLDRFDNDPLTKATLELTIGRAYFGMSDFASAEAFQKRGVAQLTDAVGSGNDAAVEARYQLARTLGVERRFEEAGQVLAQADAAAGAQLDQPTPLALMAAWIHGSYQQMRMQPQQALAYYEQVERIRQVVQPNDATWLFRGRGGLAWCYVRLGRYADAVDSLKALMQPSYDLQNVGATDWEKVRLEYALALTSLSRLDEAEATLKDSLQQVRQVMGDDNYVTGVVWNHLGAVYQSEAKWDAAIDAQSRSYAIMRRGMGEQSPAALTAGLALAIPKYLSGQAADALPLLQTTYSGLSKAMGGKAPMTQNAAFYLAAALNDLRRPDEAMPLLQGLQAAAVNSVDPGIDWEQRIAGLKGAILLRQGREAQGRPLVEEAVAQLTRDKAPGWMVEPLRAALGEQQRGATLASSS
jgi:eukaryotic-like serine/threonine-protein kinase